jgi:HprK-related kinase A
VERGGQALLLPATPGAGKSTLCAGLAWRGWRLLSDEFGLVRRPQGDLFPLPRAVPLKNESIAVIRSFAPEAFLGPLFPKTRKGDVSHMRPPHDSLPRQQEPAAPRWIVFPRYQRGLSVRLRTIPDSLAFTRLAHNSFNYRLLGAVGFRALAALIRRCDCFSLEYGDLEAAASSLAEMAGA